MKHILQSSRDFRLSLDDDDDNADEGKSEEKGKKEKMCASLSLTFLAKENKWGNEK